MDISERKRQEEAMKKEEQELKLIFDSSPIIVFYKDKEGRFVRVNKAFIEALKIPEEKFLGKTVFDIYSATIAQGMTNDDQEVFKSGRSKLNIIEQYESASGIRWVQTDKVPIFDNKGILLGLVGFAQDITERKRAEEEALLANERLRYLLSSSAAAIYTSKTSGDYAATYVTDSVSQITGYEAQEFVKESHFWIDHIHPEDRQRVLDELPRIFKTGQYSYEYRFRHSNGRYIWMQDEMRLVRDDKGSPLEIVGYWSDITARKQAEDELRKYQSHLEEMVQERTAALSAVNEKLRHEVDDRKKAEIQIMDNERRLRELTESLPQLVWTCLPDGPCDYLSRQWIEYTGIQEAEQLGSGWLQQIHPDDRERVIATWNKTVKKDLRFDLEFRIRRSDGVYRWFKTRAVPLRGADGAVVKWFGSNTDIEDLKLSEEALRDSEEKLRAQKEALEQKNIAIREIMEQIGAEKQRIRDDVLTSVDKVLLPILRKLRGKATRIERRHIDVLRNSLEALASSFGRKLSDMIIKLTPREVEVCTMIRSGLMNKEMAKILHISQRSIETHRHNIRKKLGLANKKVNLTSYLQIH